MGRLVRSVGGKGSWWMVDWIGMWVGRGVGRWVDWLGLWVGRGVGGWSIG